MNVLSVAGSDPSSGAGIQGDLKTFASLGVHGLTVITALTSQNTSKFFKVFPVEPSAIRSQLKSVLSDFKIDTVKIGMVYNNQTIKAVHNELKNIKVPIVLDPIFESTTGGKLICNDALADFKKFLMPISYVITPNIPEAERIADMKIRSLGDMKRAATIINQMGPKNVIIKGGHTQENQSTDLLLENKRFHVFSQKRIKKKSHGGGCIFSASLCVSIARGSSLVEAAKFSQQISYESIKNSAKIGKGLAITTQKTKTMENELASSINEFTRVENIYQYIPECQTNFVYAKSSPRSTEDILGLEGRIVKTGVTTSVAGELKFGGSKHVASAVLEMSRKFPQVRSALNIRYDEKIIKKAIAKKFHVSYYDRSFEPYKNKKKDGTTISWGIKSAIKDIKTPPDIIYHKGDVGKEPMTLIFGKTPSQVLTKLVKIIT